MQVAALQQHAGQLSIPRSTERKANYNAFHGLAKLAGKLRLQNSEAPLKHGAPTQPGCASIESIPLFPGLYR